jgi:predicted dehydrogenase
MSDKLQNPLGIAIIGCGLIGKKRAAALAKIPEVTLVAACDLDIDKAREVAKTSASCRATDDYRSVLQDPSVDALIVATLNASLAPISLDAVRAGKHVLVEKPGALNSKQLETILTAAETTGAKVRIGYNHRYHPAIQKAKAYIDEGALGELMFMRGRYGHGGRRGYDREWRADPKLSGGGELIDQGVHLIDLAQWILGDFAKIEGHACTSFWDMPVDDNAFLSLRTAAGKTAWLHVSCSEWKNLFSLEIYGRSGKLAIDGLGGSYGVEKITFYKMLPEMGPPDTVSYEYPRGDESWAFETKEFLRDIDGARVPSPGLQEGIRILQVVEAIYESSGYPVSKSTL